LAALDPLGTALKKLGVGDSAGGETRSSPTAHRRAPGLAAWPALTRGLLCVTSSVGSTFGGKMLRCSKRGQIERSRTLAESTAIEPLVLDGTFQQFIGILKDLDAPGPTLSPRRFSEVLHIDLQTLAEQAHVDRNTITRAPNSCGVQDLLRDALREIKAATDLNGDVNRAAFWYRNEPRRASSVRRSD
jgi:hypothetical protein